MRLRILLTTDNHKHAVLLERALSAVRHQVVAAISADEDLCTYVRYARPDAVVVSRVVADAALAQQLNRVSHDQPLPVVMFTDCSDSAATRAMVKAGVSAYVVDGLQPARVAPVLETALVRFREFQTLRQERDAAVTRLSERKQIDHANSILMHRSGLPQNAAYQTLRRLAVNRGICLAEAAEDIITAEKMLATERLTAAGNPQFGE
ncbi:MAG: ANTAR domain-containing response regulator [Sulfuricaulis sp.]